QLLSHHPIGLTFAIDNFHTDHQSETADLTDRRILFGKSLKSFHDQEPGPLGMREKLLLLDDIDGCERGRAGNRIATICTTMAADCPPVHQFLPGDDTGHREPAGDALRHNHDVRFNIPVLAAEPSGSAPKSTLYLIENQKNAVLVAQLAQALQV